MKTGNISGKISIGTEIGVAHSIAEGVNVYVVIPGVDVFTTEGLQLPVIVGALLDELGSVTPAEFWQYGPKGVKVGTIGGLIVISIVVGKAHSPAFGVKV